MERPGVGIHTGALLAGFSVEAALTLVICERLQHHPKAQKSVPDVINSA
jgi:hypothetical protein